MTKNISSGASEREYRRAAQRTDDANAFIPDPTGQSRPLAAADAESFAEEFIGAATGGESVSEDAEDEVGADEEGGPFIMLDDKAQLPPESQELGAASEVGQAPRGASWSARGV